jgi:hypothetical protein
MAALGNRVLKVATAGNGGPDGCYGEQGPEDGC